jgi:hypothetical protein
MWVGQSIQLNGKILAITADLAFADLISGKTGLKSISFILKYRMSCINSVFNDPVLVSYDEW